MTEIKEFKPSTKENAKPEKPAEVIDFETAKKIRQQSKEAIQKYEPQDLETEELLKTVMSMVEKIFAESTNKKLVLEQLHHFLEKLEQGLKDK